ncbi:hypothetical protein [Phaeodactylibacter xiamenensis]|uniref:hypothetical protein n=1 Tax=Phaeodactylibacter xiamenensis TaxID=1524460 RepID=UPI003CCB9261
MSMSLHTFWLNKNEAYPLLPALFWVPAGKRQWAISLSWFRACVTLMITLPQLAGQQQITKGENAIWHQLPIGFALELPDIDVVLIAYEVLEGRYELQYYEEATYQSDLHIPHERLTYFHYRTREELMAVLNGYLNEIENLSTLGILPVKKL